MSAGKLANTIFIYIYIGDGPECGGAGNAYNSFIKPEVIVRIEGLVVELREDLEDLEVLEVVEVVEQEDQQLYFCVDMLNCGIYILTYIRTV